MKEGLESALITAVPNAVYVPPNTGKHVHKNRPFHGFVINCHGCVRDYCFSDGSILHVEENTLFYLPKGSSYEVKTISVGGCYAINFEADIALSPFALHLKAPDSLRKSFKLASEEWRKGSRARLAMAMRALYSAVAAVCQEDRGYYPSARFQIISPALLAIEEDFLKPELSVSSLAALCGVSEVYLRRLFTARFGISPKEYILRKRMDYACQLLSSGQFEVAEVALLCGYAEPCHFSREFKKRTGLSPKDYL